jgi:hypothetical protein
MRLLSRRSLWIGLIALSLERAPGLVEKSARADVTSAEVQRAIEQGVKFLLEAQQPDGSWPGAENAVTGTTSLAMLALLSAGVPTDSPPIQRALKYLRSFNPIAINSTYAVGLQAMVFAAAEPQWDRARIAADAEWLERMQHGNRSRMPGNWSYGAVEVASGDNSNTQYALLGLNAAREAGIPIQKGVFEVARGYLEFFQNPDGGWGYQPGDKKSRASMTCAGIAGLIFCGSRPFRSLETLDGEAIEHCGEGRFDPHLSRGINWLATHFAVSENVGMGQTYKLYYLYGLERAGRLAGLRFFGRNDWYRRGALELVATQDRNRGFWQSPAEHSIIGTSFALLFLAKGRSPVLINKLSHRPDNDWDNDADDVRNMVSAVSEDWKHLLTWQRIDPEAAKVDDLLQAPIVYFNGHKSPLFNAHAKAMLRRFVEQGGLIFAEACCGKETFDRGVRQLMKEIFPEEDCQLHPLAADHAIWRAKYLLTPDTHPLWGIELGCRTVVVYSPRDLSCYWNQVERSPSNPAVIQAFRIGHNIIDYATGREMPRDKLTSHLVELAKPERPQRGALRIAKLRHAGEWNVAPRALPNLMEALRRPPLSFDVVVAEKDLFPRDPGLVYYPLVYLHGRSPLHYEKDDLQALARHLNPGGGTLFADAACGNSDFDASFRQLVSALIPNRSLVPIPHDDQLYSMNVAFDLKDVQYTRAAGGRRGFPELEGVKLDDHWAIIYSKYDIGCALERNTQLSCKGYTHSSAVRIATNIVVYSTLP